MARLQARQSGSELIRSTVCSASLKKHDEQTLRSTGLDFSWLKIEIIENFMMINVDDAAAILGDMRKLVVAISGDDFGTGYSSWHYRKRFPINILKIDRSFAPGWERRGLQDRPIICVSTVKKDTA